MAGKGRPKVEWVDTTCLVCSKIRPRRVTDLARQKTDRVFCGQACRTLAGAKPRRGETVACGICGTEFYRGPGDDKRFCSRACADAWQARNQVERACDYCGILYVLKPSQAFAYRQHGRFYCSKRCEGLGKIKRPLDRMHNGKPAVVDNYGYVKLWDPDNVLSHGGWVAEHRLVAQTMIDRPLTADDEVNHINRIKTDNRPENLQIVDAQTHSVITAGQRQSDMNLLAEYIKRFGPLN